MGKPKNTGNKDVISENKGKTVTTNMNNIATPNSLNTFDMLRQSRELLYEQNVQGNRPPQNMQNMTTNQNMQCFQGQDQVYLPPQPPNYNTTLQNQNMNTYQPFNGQGFNVQQSTTQLDNGIPPWASNMCQQLTSIQNVLEHQNSRWQSVEQQIKSQSERMKNIESQLSQVSIIKQTLSQTNTDVNQMHTDMRTMKMKISEYDNTIQEYSNICDGITDCNTNTEATINGMQKQIRELEQNQQDIQTKQNDKITEIQWRSMRENLIFSGIPEITNYLENGEDCEFTIHEFFKNELHIEEDIKFDRAHRLGRFSRNQLFPRPIVVKFTYYKDKERIRQLASKELKDSNFWIKEQYPKEMEDKRKILYPVANDARKNPENKVRLVRDKLFINHEQYIPEVRTTLNSRENVQTSGRTHVNRDSRNSRSNSYMQHDQNYQARGGYKPSQTQWSRTFSRRPQTQKPEKNEQNDNFLENRFNIFSQMNSTPSQVSQRTQHAGKTKARSPLDNDVNVKKHRENGTQYSDSEDSEDSTLLIDCDQTQPPQSTYSDRQTGSSPVNNPDKPRDDTTTHSD